MLDNQHAILFIRGEKPILDEKYDILKHPNVALTTDGKAKPYVHGGTEQSVATISFAPAGTALTGPAEESETMYELLSNEELEARYLTEEVSTNETVSEEEP